MGPVVFGLGNRFNGVEYFEIHVEFKAAGGKKEIQ